jgi:hypothetical protein
MKIPKGSTARINLDLNLNHKIEIQRNQKAIRPEKIIGLQSGKFRLSAGNYLIIVSSGQ